jgi:phosphotransferase system IIA component
MGTIPLEGAVQKTSEAAHTVVVKTKDGIEHLFHLTGRTAVHGGKAAGDDALRGLEEGSTVVVHYTAEGDRLTAYEVDRIAGDGLQAIEGTVTKVDRRAKTISIRLADGSQQTLRLTERAASGVGKDIDDAAAGTAKVVVYFDDLTGRRVAHYFKRVS